MPSRRLTISRLRALHKSDTGARPRVAQTFTLAMAGVGFQAARLSVQVVQNLDDLDTLPQSGHSINP